MLTDTKLRNLKTQDRTQKVADRDGLYVAVSPTGGISFRNDCAVNGRQKTIAFGHTSDRAVMKGTNPTTSACSALIGTVSRVR